MFTKTGKDEGKSMGEIKIATPKPEEPKPETKKPQGK